MVPTRVSVPVALSMITAGRVPAAVVAAPVKVWAPLPSMRRVPVPPSKVEAWLMAPWAATVPVVIVPSVRASAPLTVRVVPRATVWVTAPLKTTSLRAGCR